MNYVTKRGGKRKLSDYSIELGNVTVDHVPHSPVTDNKPQKKKIRHSFGCCRDLDWQRRMEGFTGLSIKNDMSKPIKARTSKKSTGLKGLLKNVPVNWHHSPETQQDIDDWPSSDEDCFPENSKHNEINDNDDDGKDIDTTVSVTPESEASELSDSGKHQQSVRQYLKEPDVHEVFDECIVDDSSDSGDADRRTSDNTDSISKGSVSPIIYTSDSQTPGEQLGTFKKSRVSEWIKNISWKPHTEQKTDADDGVFEASHKKKNIKYLKGGLAEKLQRLIKQERSDQAFYAHKLQNMTPCAKSENAKSFHVEIIYVQRGYLLVSTLSTVIEQPDVRSAVTLGECVFIMFTKSTWLQHKLDVGVKLRVYAPWQVLKQPNNCHVILCTYHVEVTERPFHQKTESDTVFSSEYLSTVARWICPCIKDNSLASTQCPANTHPVYVNRIWSSVQHNKLGTAVKNAENRQVVLETMTSSPYTSVPHSLLMAIEKNTQQTEKSVDFVATVQRIFHKMYNNLKNSSSMSFHRDCGDTLVYTLLLQDFCGFLCELILPLHAESKAPWKTLISHGEGKVYEFRKLSVLQRINRGRSSLLFTIIDSVWSYTSVLEKANTSQDSGQIDVFPAQPPLFSYLLQAPAGEATCTEYKTQGPSVYCPKAIKSFTDVLALLNSEQLVRCTMEGIVIYEKKKKHESSSDKLIYAVSKYEETGCLKIVVPLSACYKIREVSKKCLLLQDIFIGQGQCMLDEYSSVGDNGIPFPLLISRVIKKLPKFAIPANVGSLYSLQGSLYDVDEQTAYSWLACDQCTDDKLQGGTTIQPFLYCNQCKRGVTKPLTRMHLEVYVAVPGLSEGTVKVKLLQYTIESILPKDVADDDEGYDVQTVLGKYIGPIPVILVSTLQKNYFLEEINIS